MLLFCRSLKKNFWPYRVAFEILVPQPWIKPTPPAVEAQSLNPWTTREVHYSFEYYILMYYTYLLMSLNILMQFYIPCTCMPQLFSLFPYFKKEAVSIF